MPQKKNGDSGLHSSNLEFFIRSVNAKPTVEEVVRVDDRIFHITREKDELTVYLANIYILGEADVDEILGAHPDVDAIVNVNSYNTHTSAALELANFRGVSLFKINEFMGALYYYGQQFMDYTPPEHD